MRNLKRALSLALSAAMIVGMMVMGASAAGYQDVDASNDHQEAIEVLQAVGIMTGDENGNFNPDGSITRNEMAVVMTHLLNLDYDYYRGTNIYSDVPEWAAPYVAACVAEGVTAGIGNGLYGGDNKITAAQGALMIMKALGYFQNAEDFGSDWQVATIRQASYINLFDNINSNAESALTRAQVAQLVLNGLKSDMVTFTGDKGIQIGDVTVGYKAEYTVRTSSDKKYNTLVGGTTDIVASDKYTIQLGEELYNGKLTERSATDAFERPATTWRYDNSDIGTYADDPDASYTTGVKIGTIYNDLGLTKGIADEDTTVYEDGVVSTSTTTVNGVPGVNWGDIDIVKGQTAKIGGNGTLTEVYYNDEDNSVIIVVTNTYVAKVTGAFAETTTAEAFVRLDNAAPFTGAGVSFETDEFAKDDIVAYTYSYKAGDTGVQSMELAEKATGAMSTYTTTGSVTVAGTKYDGNRMSATNIANFVTSVDKGSDVTVYLDANGYVLYVDADVEVNYAVVLNYTPSAGDFNKTPKAELLFTDGTVKTVEVNAVAGANLDGNNQLNAAKGGDALSKYDIVAYTVNSKDVYTITRVADAQDAKDGGAFEMKNGSNTFSITSPDNLANTNGSKVTHYADGKTIFLVADTSNPSKVVYSAYEGIANMPTITKEGSADNYVTVFMNSTTNNDPATVVFIEKNASMRMASDNKDVIYVKGSTVGTSYTTELGSFYEYDAFINGEATTIKVATAMQMTEATLVYGPVYNEKGILTNAEDYVSASRTTDGSLRYTTTTDSVVNDVVKLGGIPYAYTSDVNVYYVTVDGELLKVTMDTITEDSDDQVFFKVNDKGLLTDVYVKVVDATTGVTPGNGKLASVSLARGGAGNLYANVTLTAAAPSTGALVSLSVEKYMPATNVWVTVASGNAAVASGSTTGASSSLIANASITAGEIYRVTATYDGGTLVSANFVA